MHAIEYFRRLHEREWSVLVDDVRYQPFFRERGFDSRALDSVDLTRPELDPVFIVFANAEAHERFLARWGEIPGISVHLSLAKFDTSPAIIEYSLEQFMAIDIADTLARRRDYYDAVLSCNNAEVRQPHGPLLCTMGDTVEIANRDDEFEPGWLYSVSELLEASLVNIECDRSTFTLNGEFAFDGMIYLFNNPGLRAELSPLLERWLELATQGDNKASFEDNAMTQLILGGQDQSAELRRLTEGRERGSAATEFAFGCVDYDLARQDWSRNSVMHESFWGVHVGIGMGQEIPHFDLIARRAQCQYIGTPAS